jgi:hypothetical protein
MVGTLRFAHPTLFGYPAAVGCRGSQFLPMASSATPVSAAAEQQHQDNDNEDQFHGTSPLKLMASF